MKGTFLRAVQRRPTYCQRRCERRRAGRYIHRRRQRPGRAVVLTTPEGKFIKKEEPVFNQYKDFEDVAVIFFDADGDGDLDLFGTGGNNIHPPARELQHRLYINDGKGNFTIDVYAFPQNDMNISVAANYDFNGDGEADLFVGSRSVPFQYGTAPRSYIYKNDGKGHFTDVTPPEIANIGMVTGAVWADINGDGKKELMITGEWMRTRMFSIQQQSV